MQKLMRLAFKTRGLAMVPPMVFLLLYRQYEYENHLFTFGIGCVLFFAGLALRIVSQMHLRYRLRCRKVLTRTGPYRWVRNPIYIGNGLILLSACFFGELPWFAPIMLLYVAAVYALVVGHEETHLRAKHGAAYEAFLAEVPRWIPRRPRSRSDGNGEARRFFGPSLLAEAHCLLIVLPFLAKEVLLS